jgi:hypothetical protein
VRNLRWFLNCCDLRHFLHHRGACALVLRRPLQGLTSPCVLRTAMLSENSLNQLALPKTKSLSAL